MIESNMAVVGESGFLRFTFGLFSVSGERFGGSECMCSCWFLTIGREHRECSLQVERLGVLHYLYFFGGVLILASPTYVIIFYLRYQQGTKIPCTHSLINVSSTLSHAYISQLSFIYLTFFSTTVEPMNSLSYCSPVSKAPCVDPTSSEPQFSCLAKPITAPIELHKQNSNQTFNLPSFEIMRVGS
jgi:hypothetical protein